MRGERFDFDAVAARLRAAGCVAADDEAAEFVAAAPDAPTLEGWLVRREHGEPSAWITGVVEFGGRSLRVGAGVYVPRAQTEELAARAAALLPPHGRAVDLCTGAGAIAAHLRAEVPTAAVVGVDVDLRAASCARRNGVPVVVGDLGAPLRAQGIVDVVTAVAPYVPTDEIRLLAADVQRHEPHRALDGGPDGLDVVRRIVRAAAALLRTEGYLLLELGGEQDGALAPTLETAGFAPAEPWHDEDGDLRGVVARLARRP